MTAWDFVIGVLFGIIVCCKKNKYAIILNQTSHGTVMPGFFFVIQNSQLPSIRAVYTGDLAMSAVRRPSLQRAYIGEVSKQTTILRLQGTFRVIFNVINLETGTIRLPILWHHNICRRDDPQPARGTMLAGEANTVLRYRSISRCRHRYVCCRSVCAHTSTGGGQTRHDGVLWIFCRLAGGKGVEKRRGVGCARSGALRNVQ